MLIYLKSEWRDSDRIDPSLRPGGFMHYKLKLFSSLGIAALLSACASTKYVTPQEKIKEPWIIAPATKSEHHQAKTDDHGNQEASANATAKVTVEVTPVEATSSTDIIENISKAVSDPGKSSWIKIDEKLSTWKKTEWALYNLFMSPAYASSKTPYYREIGGAEATKFVAHNPEASKLFTQIESFKISHDGGPKPEFMTLQLKMKNGSIVSGVVDFDWKRSCDFLDKSLPSTGKLTFAVSDAKNAASKMRHPFDGKPCSQSNLDAYRFFNFDAGVSSKAQGTPAAFLLVSKDPKKGINLAFFRNEEGNTRSVGTALTNAFKK